ncbi:MAG: 1-acyl-sn-glycerol-3-phosphate acyltransferase [Pirellulales bacterium]|nr:1-acyl-sn-glycerol-3-phosphate acyltransferase [Pirellulales bacterium]
MCTANKQRGLPDKPPTQARQPESVGRSRTRAGQPNAAQRSLVGLLWYRLWQRVLQVFWVLLYRVRRTGMHNIPAKGPILLAPNHQSHLDPPLVGCCCPRRMSYMGRATLFSFAPFGWFIRSLGAFPIDREGQRGIGGIRETLRRLKQGEVIMVFPEGSRTYDGLIHPFLPGIRTLAIRSGATIVPVAIEGAYQAWPRWRRFPRLGTIHVHFGAPLLPEEIQELGEDALVEEVERRVRRYHAEVCNHPTIARSRRYLPVRPRQTVQN